MKTEQKAGVEDKSEVSSLPEVEIQIGADNNTVLINGEKKRLSRQPKQGGLPTQTNIDTLFLLQYLGKNQRRWIPNSELVKEFTRNIKEQELRSDVVSQYVSIRISKARNMLENRVRVAGKRLISLRPSTGSLGAEIGVFDYTIHVQRVLIDLSGYPYPFNQR